jgi:hypothetical protein
MRGELLEGKFSSGTSFDDRLAAFEGGMTDPAAGDDGTGSVDASSLRGRGKVDLSGFDEESKRRIFQDLVARRKRLKPSEQKMLRALSKDLDMRVPTGGGRGHRATKMDRQLAAMDPSLAAVLRAGGEEDAGGDLKVHDDILSKGAFKAANAGRPGLGGLESSGGSGGLGPGPNIHNTNYFNTFQVQQQIDARGNADAATNITAASHRMAQAVNQVQFTGFERVLAAKNSGGRMA